MPTYEFECPEGHQFEIFVQCVSSRPDAPPCPCAVVRRTEDPCPRQFGHAVFDYVCVDCPVEEGVCGAPAKQVFRTAPILWIPGVNKETVLDYPGSKRLKAGYVHHMVDPGVKKVSSGYGGVLNPSFKERHPLAKVVQPDWKAPKEQ